MTTNDTHEAIAPGAFDTRPIEVALKRAQPSEPAILWDGVLDAVTSSKDETETLAILHRQRYDSPSFPGAAAPLFEPLLDLCEKHRAAIAAYLTSLKKRATATNPFIDEPGEGTVWTPFDLVKVAVLVLVSVALLTIGVFTVSQILLASGLPGFEDKFRRYLFSGVPVGGAFALKNIGSLLSTDRNRYHFTGFTLIAGVVLAIAWAGLFVSSFESGPMSSAGDILAELMADPGEGDASGDTGSALLFVGLIAEMFLAAGCWLEIERIVMGHRRPRRTPNPLRIAIDEEISHWTGHLVTVTTLVGSLGARLTAIENGRATYVSRALNQYRLRCRGLQVDDPRRHPSSDDLDGDPPSDNMTFWRHPPVPERRPT